MAKIKVRVKEGTKGKPLGQRVVEFKAKEGAKGQVLAVPKVKLNVHLDKW